MNAKPKSIEIDGVIYYIGDKVPHKRPKLVVNPAYTGPDKPSFKPKRKK